MKIKLPDAETMMERLRNMHDSAYDRKLYALLVQDADSVRTPQEVVRMIMAAIILHVRNQGSSRAVHAAYLMNIEMFIDALVVDEYAAHIVKECHVELRGDKEVLKHLRRIRPPVPIHTNGKKRGIG